MKLILSSTKVPTNIILYNTEHRLVQSSARYAEAVIVHGHVICLRTKVLHSFST